MRRMRETDAALDASRSRNDVFCDERHAEGAKEKRRRA